MLLANFNRKEHLRHRAVSLRQHGFLVMIGTVRDYLTCYIVAYSADRWLLSTNFWRPPSHFETTAHLWHIWFICAVYKFTFLFTVLLCFLIVKFNCYLNDNSTLYTNSGVIDDISTAAADACDLGHHHSFWVECLTLGEEVRLMFLLF